MSQKFTHYGKQDGLNQSSVNYIYQDSQDYLWIANFGGINRFDGYTFTSYVNEFDDPSSISDNSVWTILEDNTSVLWFGTKNGISRYNPEEDNFTNYFIRNSDESLGTLAVKSLFCDKNGNLYVGSEGEGLYVFSKEKEMFSLVKAIPENAKVHAITEDNEGNLWVGTENLGLFMISLDRSISTSFMQSKSLQSRTIWSLYADDKGSIWIGTDADGLIRYDPINDQFIHYKEAVIDFNYTAGDKIKSIAKGKNDIIWIGSATKGLSYFSYKKNGFYNYKNNRYDRNSLFDDDVSSIVFGANNVLYVGFYTKGFDKVVENPFKVLKNNPESNNTLSNNNVYSMYLDKNQILWFGTYGGGLTSYDPTRNRFVQYRFDENDPTSISHDWVRIIYEDSNNDMWVGTWGGGLNKFDRDTGVFKRYKPKTGQTNSLNHNIITALFEDTDGELWIGTYGGGINIYQPVTDDFRSIVHDRTNINSLSDDHITSFYQDKNGLIWICTYGGGLNSYDKKTDKFKRFLPDPKKEYSLNNYKTLHVFEVPNEDYFWITTLGGGINKFYYKEEKFLNYTEKEGLSNNSTMGMLRGGDAAYWISSNNGISRFDPKAETFTNYTTHDGLGSDDFNLEAYAKTEDGTLYFGGKKGVTYFNPREVGDKATFPSIIFTGVTVNDSVYTNLSQKIEASYKSRIRIQYAAINADKTDKIKYAYQLIGQDDQWLIGQDDQWRYMDQNRYLEFTNLDPGDYELRVRSTNSNTIWNEKYAHFFIQIPVPWHMSWYFRGGILLLLLLGSYGYYRVRLNRAQKQNRLLEEKVKKRTKTIKNQNIALEKAKNKTELAYKKLKKLENYKNEFTGMLAHDLKNPLVTILGYSSEKPSDKNLKTINQSGKRMLNLIENMLEVQKFENTEVQLHLNSYNLKTVVDEAVNQVSLLAQEKRIHIKNNIKGFYTVNIDKDIIERVLVNLLTNGIKFSPIESEIDVVAIAGETSNELIVCVQDYGVGIPKDKVASVFSKFSQLEARDSGKIRSTGLGLTFCKMAVEAHKGKIWVESKINEGSTFFFQLERLQDNFLFENNTKIKKGEHKDLLNLLVFDEKDRNLLIPFSEKINTLSIYEMGEWMDLFDKLSKQETDTINKWKDMMMDALSSFDKDAFLYLKKIAINIAINKKT